MNKRNFWGIKNPHWWSQETNACFQLCYPWMHGFANIGKYFGKDYKVVVVFFQGNYGWHFLDTAKSIELAQHVLKKHAKSSRYLKGIIKQWDKHRQALVKVFRLIDKTNLKELNRKELQAIYQKLMSSYIEEFRPAMIIEAFEPYVSDIFYPQLKNYPITLRKKINFLLQPNFVSFITQHQIDLLKLALLVAKNKRLAQAVRKNNLEIIKDSFSPFYTKLSNHQQQYFWLKNNYFYINYLDKSYFLNLIREEVSNKKANEIAADLKKLRQASRCSNQKKILSALTLPSEARAYLEIAGTIGWWQDERKKLALMSGYYLKKILILIAKQIKLDPELILYLRPKELNDWLLKQKEMQVAELAARKKFSVWISNGQKEVVFSGPPAKSIAKMVFPDRQAKIKSFKGIAASPGVVKGKVRLVLDVNKDRFEDQEILVASMTRPEFVPLMKRASAIITNEGGLTCHAAIVSRELGIPCIVGTKIATKVLKNGDLVEVRAHRGEVVIL